MRLVTRNKVVQVALNHLKNFNSLAVKPKESRPQFEKFVSRPHDPRRPRDRQSVWSVGGCKSDVIQVVVTSKLEQYVEIEVEH